MHGRAVHSRKLGFKRRERTFIPSNTDLRDFLEFTECKLQAASFDVIMWRVSKKLMNCDDVTRNLHHRSTTDQPFTHWTYKARNES